MPPAFGTFRVLHQIGSGVLGPVFRTYDPHRDRLVAVKAFRLDIVPEQVAKLAEALRRLVSLELTQSSLVPMLEAGLEGTTAYLASGYMTAETLDVALRHLAPAPLERVEPMLSQMADAIDAAWVSGVGHGALHPRDVFVTVDTNEVHVSGFGVIRALESVGIKTPVRRPYAAPERLAGEDWDARADVYSLGAIAHELLTRRRPAGPGEQDGALTIGTSAEQRVLIRRVLSSALAERPEHRFPSARAFADALGAIVRGEPLGPLPEIAPSVQPAAPDAGEGAADAFDLTPLFVIHAPQTGPDVPAAFDTAETEGLTASDPAPPDTEVSETHPEPHPTAEPEPPALDAHDPPTALDVQHAPDEPSRLDESGVPVMVGDPEPLWRSPVEHTSAPMFGHLESPEPSAFPWAAVVAVGAACITLGLVIGFQWGRRTVPVPPVPPAVAVAKPIDTEVPVTPEPARTLETPAPAATRAGKEPVVTGPGRIIVRSTPVGAMVVVDGRPHGQTPVTVKDLALGPHTIEVARPGYVPHSARVVLSPRHEARTLSVALRAGKAAGAPATAAGTPVPTLGSIYVDSRPRGARVMIDGRFVGTSPLGVPELRPGDHTVQLDLAGRRPFSTKLAVKAGETARVTATLVERN